MALTREFFWKSLSSEANLLRADLNYLLAKGELDVATGVAPK